MDRESASVQELKDSGVVVLAFLVGEKITKLPELGIGGIKRIHSVSKYG